MRTGTRFDEIQAAQAQQGLARSGGGTSSFYALPASGMDPDLFEDNDHLRPEVRQWIEDTTRDWFEARFNDSEDWLSLWVMGSSITRQWSQGGPGDLDVMIGIDWPAFIRHNREWYGIPSDQIASEITSELHESLWIDDWYGPSGEFSRPFDVTFYVQHKDVRDLNPYAAYDVLANRFLTRLDVEEDWDPYEYFSDAEKVAVHRHLSEAERLLSRFRSYESNSTTISPVARQEQERKRWEAGEQVAAFFDDLRESRTRAFSPKGGGYLDFHNFRWQAHKQYGTYHDLREVRRLVRDHERGRTEELYGTDLPDAETLRTRAALYVRGQ